MKKSDFSRMKKIAKNRTLPIIDGNALVKNGKIRVTNLEISLEMPTEITGTGVIPLTAIEKPFDKAWISDGTLFVQRGNAVLKSKITDEEGFPLDHPKGCTFTDEFDFNSVDKLKKVAPFVAKDEMRPAMEGVFIDVKENLAVATDTHILVSENIPVSFEQSIILPKNFIESLSEIAYKVKFRSEVNDNIFSNIIFTALDGSETISSRLIDARYPNYMAVLPKNNMMIQLNRKNLITQVEQSLMDENPVNLVILSAKGDELTVYSENIDTANIYKSEIEATTNFPERFTIGYNAKLLLKVLKYSNETIVSLLVSASNRATMFDNCLLMPIMIEGNLPNFNDVIFDKDRAIPQPTETVENIAETVDVPIENTVNNIPTQPEEAEIVEAEEVNEFPDFDEETEQTNETDETDQADEAEQADEVEQAEQTEQTEQVEQPVFIIKNFTPKSFIVFGNVADIAQQLEALHGRFTKNIKIADDLKVDAYWFSNKRLEAVEKLLNN